MQSNLNYERAHIRHRKGFVIIKYNATKSVADEMMNDLIVNLLEKYIGFLCRNIKA